MNERNLIHNFLMWLLTGQKNEGESQMSKYCYSKPPRRWSASILDYTLFPWQYGQEWEVDPEPWQTLFDGHLIESHTRIWWYIMNHNEIDSGCNWHSLFRGTSYISINAITILIIIQILRNARSPTCLFHDKKCTCHNTDRWHWMKIHCRIVLMNTNELSWEFKTSSIQISWL